MTKLLCVVTSIQPPTDSMTELVAELAKLDAPLLVLGDSKGPDAYDIAGAELVSLEQQMALPFALARDLPTKHYARKNLGYLLAMQRGATCIYETDDDNAPNDAWRPGEASYGLSADAAARGVKAPSAGASRWFNVYRAIDPESLIWPRGFPLDMVRDASTYQAELSPSERKPAPIQQGLANVAPDVDAVWRLLLDRPYDFPSAEPLRLPAGCWCPFNSQNTWWHPPAFMLMYLPSYCSFRMTDIWRGFVAQRCLWALGDEMVFHHADVVQQRNEHNLMRDFNDEVVGYQHNADLVETLMALDLKPGADAVGANLLTCYEALVSKGYVGEKELGLVQAWVADVGVMVKG